MNEEFNIGEIICTPHQVFKIKTIDDDITLESLYREKVYDVTVERSRLLELNKSKYTGIMCVLSRISKSKN